jgi:hypothetical protein
MAYRLFPARNVVVMKRQAAISTLVLAILLTLAATMLPLTSTTGDAAAPAPGSQAIEELLQRAASHVARGQLDQGAATLERALRIAPRDAQLWQQLAEVRLLQGELKQAEAMAKKSNRLTQDVALRARNDALIVAAQGSPPTAKASPPPSSSTSADLNRLTVEIERRRVAEMQVARLTEELSRERARREAAAVQLQTGKAAVLQRDETRMALPPAPTHPSAGYAEHGFKSADDEPPLGHETPHIYGTEQPRPRTGALVRVPPGHLPPPGKCRIWFARRPAGHQPPPGDCQTLAQHIPPGAQLVSR